MQLEDRGLIVDATKLPAEYQVNAFTSICRLRSGTLLAGCQTGSAKHALNATVRLCRSDDGGRTWTDLGTQLDRTLSGVPGSLSAGDLVETEPGRLLLCSTWFDRSEPDRPLFDPSTQGVLHSKLVYAESADEGRTWSGWTIIPTPGLKGCAGCGAPLLWPDGTLGVPFESYKEYDDPNPGHHAAWLAVARNGGRAPFALHPVARHPEDKVYYWDERLCIGTVPGEYFAMFWTHDLHKQQDLNVHLVHSSIHDQAERRIQPWATPMVGQIAAPLLVDDKRLLAFIVDRNRPGTMKLWSSPNRGGTWPESDCLLVHNHDERGRLTQGATNIDFNEYWDDMAKWTFGHPALVRLDNDHILAAWYAGEPGCLSLHWARVKL